MILNLLANAAQAIGGGSGTITITAADAAAPPESVRAEPADCWVCLSVSDTGCGMDDATVKRIFEPFFTTKPIGQGTGLGLSVVHGIVGAHGGGIQVTSAPETGTRFDIFLPALAPLGAALPEAAE